MKNLQTIQCFKTMHTNTLVKENIIQSTHCCKMDLKCQKIVVKNQQSKNFSILNFEMFPNIQNNLDWHENFTKITRLQGEHIQQIFIKSKHLMKEI